MGDMRSKNEPDSRYCTGTSKQRKRAAALDAGLARTASIEQIAAATNATIDEVRASLRCKLAPIIGKRSCRAHGGCSPQGAAHPRFKDGNAARASRAQLRTKHYSAAETDEELLDLRRPLTLLDTAVAQAALAIDEGGSPQSWSEAHTVYRALLAAQKTGNVETMVLRLNELGEILRTGDDNARAWRETIERTTLFAQRIEAAWALRLKASVVVNANDVISTISAFLAIVAEETNDETTQRIESRIDVEVLSGVLAEKAIAGPLDAGQDLVA